MKTHLMCRRSGTNGETGNKEALIGRESGVQGSRGHVLLHIQGIGLGATNFNCTLCDHDAYSGWLFIVI